MKFHICSYRYKEKQFNHGEESVRVLPNMIKQNIIISQLNPCSVYELRIRMKFLGKAATFLRLDDFATGPKHKINSLKVKNITDISSEIIWNPQEVGLQCATSFTIKANLASIDVKPSEVHTIWNSWKSCQKYTIKVFPRFGEKVGQSTSATFVTFPSPHYFDAWIDESRNLISWHTNQDWHPCKESITNIHYQFELVRCSSHQPQFTYDPVVRKSGASSEYAIRIDELQNILAKKMALVENSYYSVNLRTTIRNNNDQSITFDILSNLLLYTNNERKLNTLGMTNQPCVTSHQSATDRYHDNDNNSMNEENENYNNPTLILVLCLTCVLIMVITFSIYALKSRARGNDNTNIVHRLSNNMAPHYAQYFQGPMQERVSFINI